MAVVVDTFTYLNTFSNSNFIRYTSFNGGGTELYMSENAGAGNLNVHTEITNDEWSSADTKPTVVLSGFVQSLSSAYDGSRYVATTNANNYLVTTNDNWASSTTTVLESNGASRTLLTGNGQLIFYANSGANLWRIALKTGDTTYTTKANINLGTSWSSNIFMSGDGLRLVVFSSDVSTLRVYEVSDINDWSDTPSFVDHAITIDATAILSGANSNEDLTSIGLWVDDSKVSKVAVLGTPDNWTTINVQNLSTGSYGGLIGNGRFMAVSNTSSEVTIYETDDNWITSSVAQVINTTTFPELGPTFNPAILTSGNPQGYYQYMALGSVSSLETHVFQIPHVIPAPTPTVTVTTTVTPSSSPTPEQDSVDQQTLIIILVSILSSVLAIGLFVYTLFETFPHWFERQNNSQRIYENLKWNTGAPL